MSMVNTTASHDATERALVVRHARALITQTQAFFAQGQDAFLKTLSAHCFEQLDLRPHTTQAQNLRSAAQLLDRQAALFGRSLQAALSEVIEDEFDAVIPGLVRLLRQVDSSAESSGLRSMALLDVDEIERHLLIDCVAQRFSARNEAGLAKLTQSVGALLHREELTLVDNPFRPSALLRAIAVAWHLSEFDPKVVEDLLSTLDPQRSIDLVPLYASLTESLVRAGFSAQPVHRIKRAAGADSAPVPLQAATDSGGTPSDSGGLPSGFSVPAAPGAARGGVAAPVTGVVDRARQFLRKLGFGNPVAGRPDGAAAGGGSDASDGQSPGVAHPAPDPGLLGFLGGLQLSSGNSSFPPWVEGQDFGEHNVLRKMRERDEVKGATELDRGTIDTLAEVFDYVFADPAIPMQLKYVIGRLQIPVLKAAMIDRDFFLSGTHPARRLVDVLAAASVGWSPEKGEADPLYQQVNAVVKRVLAEFADDLALFSRLLAGFEAFMQTAEQQAERRIEPVADQERGVETLQAARAHADNVVHQCIDALTAQEPVPPFLLPFLTTQWRDVLARAWIDQARDSAGWQQALATMDEVIWSTQAKTHADDRSRLVAMLPDLVHRLNDSLDVIGWDGVVRSGFTRSLIGTHMKAIRSPRSAPAPLETGPNEQESAAARRALRELETRRALQAKNQADGFDAMAHAFVRGLWFDFALEQDLWRRYRLGWVSPQRTRLLFTNRDGFEAFVRSGQEVADLLRAGRLKLLDAQPIVERAIGRIMSGAEQVPVDLALV